MINNLRLIELFAGYGSQALALKYLGIPFDHHFVCEFDRYAIQSYNDIHNTNFATSDIKEIHASDLNIINTDKYKYLVTYSFPCTDLSIAGKRAGMGRESGTSSSLLWEVERILKECEELPQYLLMENVPQVIGKDNLQLFGQWTRFLSRLGYKNYYKVLNAKDYGIPQNRKRCFMVSILKSENKDFCFPDKLKTSPKFIDIKQPIDEIDKKYYLSDKTLNNIILWKSYENPLNNIISGQSIVSTLTARGAGELHSGMKIVDEIAIRTNDKQGYKKIYTGDVFNFSYPTSKSRRARVQTPLVPTLTTHNELGLLDTSHVFRTLTPKECFRLMGVKDEDFEKLTVSDTQLYKQAGNSIVVNVLMEIFKNMFIVNCKRKKLF